MHRSRDAASSKAAPRFFWPLVPRRQSEGGGHCCCRCPTHVRSLIQAWTPTQSCRGRVCFLCVREAKTVCVGCCCCCCCGQRCFASCTFGKRSRGQVRGLAWGGPGRQIRMDSGRDLIIKILSLPWWSNVPGLCSFGSRVTGMTRSTPMGMFVGREFAGGRTALQKEERIRCRSFSPQDIFSEAAWLTGPPCRHFHEQGQDAGRCRRI